MSLIFDSSGCSGKSPGMLSSYVLITSSGVRVGCEELLPAILKIDQILTAFQLIVA